MADAEARTVPAPGRRLVMLVGPAAGGIGAHAASLARGLPDLGWLVVAVTAASTAARFDLGEHVEVAWPSGGPAGLVRGVRRVRALVRGADVVHAHGHQAGLLALTATAFAGRERPRVVISWHNAVLGAGVRRRLQGLLERVQARGADLLTGASQDLVDRARALGARRTELAPVAAPAGGTWRDGSVAARAQLVAELGLDPAAPWLLTVSRIAPQKNLPVLVRAARIVGAPDVAHPPVWVVIGDGRTDLLESLTADVAADGTDVRFVGARTDVPRWMSAADLFVLPSAWEARALVVQEALATGLPVVVSAVGGLPELVRDAGVLVPPGDPQALAREVGALLADPGRRADLGRAGLVRSAELPGERDVVQQWDERYRRLARPRA